ncbi:hypothetical protein RZN25_15905 [Bacillaceae bacterium S4-13-56]
MRQHFVVANTFKHRMNCFCHEKKHDCFFTLKEGDVIEVTNDRKFTIGNGWYHLTFINGQFPFYMRPDELDQYNSDGQLLSLLDIELKLNYLHFHINQSLDKKEKMSFLEDTTERNQLIDLKEKLATFIGRVELHQ